MSLLKEFEQRFEKLFEGFFAKHFKSAVKPIELAKQLAKEMEQKKTPAISGFYLPNSYKIFLSPKDFENLSPIFSALSKELKQLLIERAKEEKFLFLGPPSLETIKDTNLDVGEIKIESRIDAVEGWQMPLTSEKTQIFAPDKLPQDKPGHAFLIPKKLGRPLIIDKDTFTIGRIENNDLVVEAQSVSRHHAEIWIQEGNYCLQDLGSTNGTFVNGKRVKRRKLKNGDLISFAEEEFEFRSE